MRACSTVDAGGEVVSRKGDLAVSEISKSRRIRLARFSAEQY
jgi:hypothetical protein